MPRSTCFSAAWLVYLLCFASVFILVLCLCAPFMMPRATAQSQQPRVAVPLPPFPLDGGPEPRDIVVPPLPITGPPGPGLPNLEVLRNAPRVVPPAPPHIPSQFPPCSPYKGPCNQVTNPQPTPQPTPLPVPQPTPQPTPTIQPTASAGSEARVLLAAYRADPTEDSVISDTDRKLPFSLPPNTGKRSAGGGALMQVQGDFATPRTYPRNETGQPGVDLGSGNFNWSTPILSLPGRAGLDVNLALSYNSLVWTKDRAGTSIKYNVDYGFPGPGFRLGMPIMQQAFMSADTGKWTYLLITPSGARVELRFVRTDTAGRDVYESADNNNVQLLISSSNSAAVRMADGTHYTFASAIYYNFEWRCTNVSDSNGNYITITYNGGGWPTTIVDTVGRTIYFDYDANQNLERIRQLWWEPEVGDWRERYWATFSYGTLTVQPNFNVQTVIGSGSTISVPMRLTLLDKSYYEFGYTIWGQINIVRHYGEDGTELSRTTYNLPTTGATAYTECPSFSEQREWIKYGLHGSDGEMLTTYVFDRNRTGVDHDPAWGYLTLPDGRTRYVESYATAGWRKGLTTDAETHYNNGQWVRKKWTQTFWMQNDEALPYAFNPRRKEVRVHDMEGESVQRYGGTRYDYNSTYGLVTRVREYYDNPETPANILRTTSIGYNLDAAYLNNRRIIGLVSEESVYDGPNETPSKLVAKTTFDYDRSGNDYLKYEGDPRQHAVAFNAGYLPRGNVCAVKRWDVTGGAAHETERGYNTSGVLIRTKDAAGHQSSISYADSFAAGAPHGNTMAYPTRATDGDGFVSTAQYDFDTGAVTQTQTPLLSQGAGSEPQGPITTMTYDAAGRIKRVTQANGGYTRYAYPADLGHVEQFTTLEDNKGEDYYVEFFEGAGRIRAAGGYLDNSTGGWRGQFIRHDEMGRRSWQTNMAEDNDVWVPVGDDDGGWRWSGREYDWQGRVTKVIHADETPADNSDNPTQEVTYGGCGCAGGQTVTTTDEVGRRQQQVYDGLGRVHKEQRLNLDGSVYSTTTNSYNARDQLTSSKQEVGGGSAGGACSAGSTTCQQTVLGYDGYGRLASRKTPQQSSATTYSYYNDDTVQTITDARGATTTFGYNGRHLPTALTYGVPGGVAATANVTLGYDAAGNRDWMDDGPGYMDYAYDTQSRLKIESRYFADLNQSYTMSYDYNVGGQLKSITDPFGAKVEYQRDRMGRVTGATGTGYADLGTPVPQFASGIKYRAWGALKELSNGDVPARGAFKLNYDSRLQLKRFEAGGKVTEHDYNRDGLVGYVRDLSYTNFNRTYVYDHVGRLKEARAGEAAPSTNPYSYTYDYDVWGNTKGRLGMHWDRNVNYTTDYSNNRNAKVEYDAAGNAVRDLEVHTTDTKSYDAAGRLGVSRELNGQGTNYDLITLGYDGDGRQAKIDYRLEGSSSGASAAYYVRSSVLGGQAVANLWTNSFFPQPNRSRAYVYLNGEMLAYHKYGHPSDPEASRSLWWTYRNPVTGTNLEQSRASSEAPVEQAVDPLGSGVGLSAPPPPAPPPSGPSSGTTLGRVEDFGFGCYLDGVETPCSIALGLVNNGAANITSIYAPGGLGGLVGGGGYMIIPDYTDTSRDYGSGDTTYGSIGYRVVGGPHSFMSSGTEGSRTESVAVTSSDPIGVAPQNPGPDVDDLRNRIDRTLNNPSCAKFIAHLFSTVKLLNPSNTLVADDPVKLFDTVRNQAGFTYGDTIMRQYGFRGAAALGSVANGNAGVELPTPIPFAVQGNPRAAAAYAGAQARIQASTSFHELIHHAGRNGINDYMLSNAVAAMRGVAAPNFPNVRRASEYWDGALQAACPQR